MEGYIIALPSGKIKSSDYTKRLILLITSCLFLSTTIFCCLYYNFFSPWRDLKISYQGSLPSSQNVHGNSSTTRLVHHCDIFSGNWIPHAERPYYTNATKCIIDDRQNCMKFGRPDTVFLKWRWKPHECELPRFDAVEFLELLRGKSLAFVGDSMARNQMQSLVCMLAGVAEPLDVSHVQDTRFRQWFYAKYNFTIAVFWSTHLVRSEDADPKLHAATYLMNLYVDEVDEAWAAQIEDFSYVIISAGQWFLRPLLYYKKGKVIGCYSCDEQNVTSLSRNFGYKMALRTSFRTLLNLKKFRGITFLRTFSPPQYENGEWNKGGNCLRTRPLNKREVSLDQYILELYLTQLKELIAAEMEGKKRGLNFRLLDATEMMSQRPDGHPNHYGHWPDANASNADCVHWCLPGPIDTWNEVLLQMLKEEKPCGLGE